jgi:uncharacterized membrane protein
MKKTLIIVSVATGGWLVYDLVAAGRYWQNGILLGYIGLVIFAMTWEKKDRVAEATYKSKRDELEGIILAIIREKGQARRHDFKPHVGLSRSSLARLLNEMEARGLIVQYGERKASYYTLAEPKMAENL